MSVIPGISYTEVLEMDTRLVDEYLAYDKIERDIERAFTQNATPGK